MFDPNDYNGNDPEREDCEDREREQEDYDERMEAFSAGRCSRRAAMAGGAEYQRDLAETLLELKEAGCTIAEPVAAALSDEENTGIWKRAVTREEKRAA